MNQRRRERQEQAIERQKLRDKRTNEEQLALIKTRPGESDKEKHRLVSLVEAAVAVNKKKNKQKRRSK
jgi:hypothetical protein